MKFTNSIKFTIVIYLFLSTTGIDAYENAREKQQQHSLKKTESWAKSYSYQNSGLDLSKFKIGMKLSYFSEYSEINEIAERTFVCIKDSSQNFRTCQNLKGETDQLIETTQADLQGQALEKFKKSVTSFDSDVERSLNIFKKQVAKIKINKQSVTEEIQKIIDENCSESTDQCSDKKSQKEVITKEIYDHDEIEQLQTRVNDQLDFIHDLQERKKEEMQNIDASDQKIYVEVLEKSLPEKFCWKANWRDCHIPTQCPEHYERYGIGLCVESCENKVARKGWDTEQMARDGVFYEKDWANVCYETCTASALASENCYYPWWGMKLHIKSGQNTNQKKSHTRYSFIAKQITNFDDRVCPPKQERWGALCCDISATCHDLGMVNCGPGACSVDGFTCHREIVNMLLSSISGVLEFALLFVAPGAGLIVNLIKDVAHYTNLIDGIIAAIYDAVVYFKNIMNKPLLKTRLINKAVRMAKVKAENFQSKGTYKGNILNKSDAELYAEIEAELGVQMKFQIEDKKDLLTPKGIVTGGIPKMIKLEDDFEKSHGRVMNGYKSLLDVKSHITNACPLISADTRGEEGAKLKCAQAMVGIFAIFDPTGLSGIVRAFMHSLCPKDLNSKKGYLRK